jgi:hypothetical protein
MEAQGRINLYERDSMSIAAARRLAAPAITAIGCLFFAGAASAVPAAVHTVTVHSASAGTGTDPNVQASISGGSYFQAFNITPNPNWGVISGTGWDSVYSDGGTNGTGGITTTYRTGGLTPANAVHESISGQFLSDNQGTLTVGANTLASNASCSDTDAAQMGDFTTPTSFTGSLPSGPNNLLFTVENCSSPASSNPTGIDFTATVSYTLTPTSGADCSPTKYYTVTDQNGTPFTSSRACSAYVWSHPSGV